MASLLAKPVPQVQTVVPTASRKSKEELLSEEVRTATTSLHTVLQWGLTVMVSFQTALFFVRREILTSDIEAGRLPKGSQLPMGRWILGTLFLLVLATIFSRLSARAAAQYRHYKEQLIASRESGITDLPIRHTSRWTYPLFFLFPAIDLVFRIYIDITFR
jgi:hypothetical protein